MFYSKNNILIGLSIVDHNQSSIRLSDILGGYKLHFWFLCVIWLIAICWFRVNFGLYNLNWIHLCVIWYWWWNMIWIYDRCNGYVFHMTLEFSKHMIKEDLWQSCLNLKLYRDLWVQLQRDLRVKYRGTYESNYRGTFGS